MAFDIVKNQNSLVSVYSNDYLELREENIGLKGSKTLVKKAYKNQTSRDTLIANTQDGILEILSSLGLEVKNEN